MKLRATRDEISGRLKNKMFTFPEQRDTVSGVYRSASKPKHGRRQALMAATIINQQVKPPPRNSAPIRRRIVKHDYTSIY